MKAVFQTTDSSCLQACFASLLETNIGDIPDFNKEQEAIHYAEHPPHWLNIQAWLKLRGLFFLEIALPANFPWQPLPFPAMCIFFGELKDGSRHSIVGRIEDDKMIPIHDPMPKAGGLQNLTALGFLVPVNPITPFTMGGCLEKIEHLCDRTSNPVVKEIRKTAQLALGRPQKEENVIIGLNGRPA